MVEHISSFRGIVNKFVAMKMNIDDVLGDLGPSQSQKLAPEMRFSLTLINSSPTSSTTNVG